MKPGDLVQYSDYSIGIVLYKNTDMSCCSDNAWWVWWLDERAEKWAEAENMIVLC